MSAKFYCDLHEYNPPEGGGFALCPLCELANNPAEWRRMAHDFYEAAKHARQGLVRLAPQYRRKDRFNAEGEYLRSIVTCMTLHKYCVQIAKEKEAAP